MLTKNISIDHYCDSLYTELSAIKAKLLEFIEQITLFEGKERKMLASHDDHLREIIKIIDWKLEILTRVCPYDWKGLSGDFERTGSVPAEETSKSVKEFSGGYVGG